MKIQIHKETGEVMRMTTILNTLEKALVRVGYEIKQINYEKGFICINPDRGAFPTKRTLKLD